MKKYHFMSLITGELVCSLHDVATTIIKDFKNHHIINFPWKYSKKGF